MSLYLAALDVFTTATGAELFSRDSRLILCQFTQKVACVLNSAVSLSFLTTELLHTVDLFSVPLA